MSRIFRLKEWKKSKSDCQQFECDKINRQSPFQGVRSMHKRNLLLNVQYVHLGKATCTYLDKISYRYLVSLGLTDSLFWQNTWYYAQNAIQTTFIILRLVLWIEWHMWDFVGGIEVKSLPKCYVCLSKKKNSKLLMSTIFCFTKTFTFRNFLETA